MEAHIRSISLRAVLAAIAASAAFLVAGPQAHAASPITCSDSKPTFGTASASMVVAASCTANVPAGATVIVHATSGVADSAQGYEARFGIGVDTAIEDPTTRRGVNVQASGVKVREESVATTLRRVDLPAGSHTFNLLTALSSSPVGNGPVNLVAPSLAVLVIPADSELRTCGAARTDSPTTTSNAPVSILSCTIAVPTAGKLIALGSGWLTKSAGAGARPAAEYEAAVQLSLGPKAEDVLDDSTRFANVYQDGAGGDGTDTTASTMSVVAVAAGSHTVDYQMLLFSDSAVGPGPVVQTSPSVTVIFVPDGSAEGRVCSSALDASGLNVTSPTPVEAVGCTLPTTPGGRALAFGSLSTGLSNGSSSTSADAWDGEFALTRGGSVLPGSTRFRDAVYDRFSTSSSFPQDGTDRGVATSTLTATSGGDEPFGLTVRRRSGTGQIRIYRGSMAVLALPPPEAAPSDTTRPVLGSLRLSRSAFKAAGSGASISARKRSVPVGAKVSFSLSEVSSVTFTVQRPSSGRKVAGVCAKPKKSNRKRSACTRWKTLRGSFTVAGTGGANAFKFRGRVGGKALAPGKYRLVGVATDPANNTSAPGRKGFRIVR